MYYLACAEYVHRAAFDNGGTPNKNVGDAWLLSWSLADDAWTRSSPGGLKPSQLKVKTYPP